MADDRIIALLQEIKGSVDEVKSDVRVINYKLDNHQDRIEGLERANFKTAKNCAEFIPKVKMTCKKTDEIDKSQKQFRVTMIASLLGIIGGMALMVIEVFRKGG